MKTIYLTFDDGPSNTTPLLLEVLRKHQVRATFFVTSSYDQPQILPEIAKAGHVIGLHSYCHEYKELYSDSAFFGEDLEKIREQVLAKTGQDSRLYRFPGGTDNYPIVRYGGFRVFELIQMLKERGYRVFDWNCENLDGNDSNLSADQYFENALRGIVSQSKLRDELIYLSHTRPGDEQSILSLNRLIPELRSRGFRFAALDQFQDSYYRLNGTYHLRASLHIEEEQDAFLVKNKADETVLTLSPEEYAFLRDKCNDGYRLDLLHTEEDVPHFKRLYLNGVLAARFYAPTSK